MTTKNIRIIGIAALLVLWGALTAFAWFKPTTEISEAERRPLAQFPELNAQTLLSGEFMGEFESYTLDQFPLRDTFRQVKALFHYNVMQQMDNNDIYVEKGFAAEMAYPLDEGSLESALTKFRAVNNIYLKKNNCKVYMTVVPDKGYYLAEQTGHLALDYEKMISMLQEGAPWATFVDITDVLQLEDYYRTDTHWRQENLLDVAEKLTSSMGASAFDADSMTVTELERPFYGVYYGQAALPMEPEPMNIMTNDVMNACIVKDQQGNVLYNGVHDMTMESSKDLYDVFLSGLETPLVIENPNAKTDKELVVFRDSYGSSLVPLLVQDYAKVTLLDIRKTSSSVSSLGFVDFTDADVLFMYSALVLNSNNI